MEPVSASTSLPPQERVLHGGDLDAARRCYPMAPEPWIDLSTGISPFAYPLPELPAETWCRLPTASDDARLRRAAAGRYGCADPEAIVAAPGTQALIQLLPRLRAPGRVCVLGPTYEEHAVCWRRAGHAVETVSSFAVLRDADVAVLVNPDNPTGRLVSVPQLRELAAHLGSRGGLLVVDEAFADVVPASASLVPGLPPSALVLRSFGKAYGLAGVRLGFAICSPGLAAELKAALGPWAVAGPAFAIGTAALLDSGWIERSVERLASAANRLDGMLARAGAQIIGGTPLFRLARHPHAQALIDRLGRQGIHVRRFPSEPKWLRVGIPGSDSEWNRLERALQP